MIVSMAISGLEGISFMWDLITATVKFDKNIYNYLNNVSGLILISLLSIIPVIISS